MVSKVGNTGNGSGTAGMAGTAGIGISLYKVIVGVGEALFEINSRTIPSCEKDVKESGALKERELPAPGADLIVTDRTIVPLLPAVSTRAVVPVPSKFGLGVDTFAKPVFAVNCE